MPILEISIMMQWLETYLTSLESMGSWGALFFVVSVAVMTMAGLPITPFAVVGGLLFGMWGGLAGVIVGSTLGAAGGFLLSRYVARDKFAKFLHKNPKFALIDHAIEREGWKIVGLLRLCPLPFGLSNFAYGLTGVSLWHYLAATIVGVLPDELVFVYFGVAGRGWFDDPEAFNNSPAVKGLFYLGLVAAVLALVMIHRIVNKRLAVANEPVN